MQWLGRQNRVRRRDQLALVAESTALLTGHVERTIGSSGEDVPSWTRLNYVAHARPQLVLRDLESRTRSAIDRCRDPWVGLRAGWTLGRRVPADRAAPAGVLDPVGAPAHGVLARQRISRRDPPYGLDQPSGPSQCNAIPHGNAAEGLELPSLPTMPDKQNCHGYGSPGRPLQRWEAPVGPHHEDRTARLEDGL
jgi:hypothetical protein